MKWGAFNGCENCGSKPKSDDELMLSIMLTDHNLSADKLVDFGRSIKAGQSPRIPESEKAKLRPAIEEAKILLGLKRPLAPGSAAAGPTKRQLFNSSGLTWPFLAGVAARKLNISRNHFEKAFLAWIYQLDLQSMMESEQDAKGRRELQESIDSDVGEKAKLEQQSNNLSDGVAEAPTQAVRTLLYSKLDVVLRDIAQLDDSIKEKIEQLSKLGARSRAWNQRCKRTNRRCAK